MNESGFSGGSGVGQSGHGRVCTDPGKSWKFLELKCCDFQAWKVLEKGIGPGKPWNSPGILK